MSTAADAMAWARAGAPAGAVVVADYQAAARGRAGSPWPSQAGRGLAFSIVLRHSLPPASQGWLYCVAGCAVTDLLGTDAVAAWPDEARDHETSVRFVVDAGTDWAVLSLAWPDVDPPRGGLLDRAITQIEHRCSETRRTICDRYEETCETIGARVRVRLLPLGPTGREIVGVARGVLEDGALRIQRETGERVVVRPQDAGTIDVLD